MFLFKYGCKHLSNGMLLSTNSWFELGNGPIKYLSEI